MPRAGPCPDPTGTPGCSRLEGPLRSSLLLPQPSAAFVIKGLCKQRTKEKTPFLGTISKPGALRWFDRCFAPTPRGHVVHEAVAPSGSCSGEITSPSVNRWPCRDPGLNGCVRRYVRAGLGASLARGVGLKALQLTSNPVFRMSVDAVSEETGLPVHLEPRPSLLLSATEAERLWGELPKSPFHPCVLLQGLGPPRDACPGDGESCSRAGSAWTEQTG